MIGALMLCVLLVPHPVSASVDGDTLIAFEVSEAASKDIDLSIQRLDPSGSPRWGGGKAIAFATADDVEQAPALCEDAEGGVLVVYEYRFISGSNAGDTDIVAQRIDKDGRVCWNEGKSPVPVAASRAEEARPLVLRDGQGGVIVVFERRDSDGDVDLLTQRISGEGKVVWGSAPVAVASSPGKERLASAVPDGQGGAIVCYEWEGKNGDIDVMAQRISAEGRVLWEVDDRARDVAATSLLERRPAAVSDGVGGVIVAYEVEFTGGDHKGDVDVRAQRLNADGKALWGADGAVVSSAPAFERAPVAARDGSGGVIVAFEYEPRSGEDVGDIDVLAQRLGSDGKMLWNGGERSSAVSTSKRQERRPGIAPDGMGGAIVMCESEAIEGEAKGDIDIVAQRIDPAGRMLWREGKSSILMAASKWMERDVVALPDGRGGAVAVFMQECVTGELRGDCDVAAMRVTSDGKTDWMREDAPIDVGASRKLEKRPVALVVGSDRR